MANYSYTQIKIQKNTEEYFYIKKELRLSNKYKKLLEYAKDFYDRP